MSIRNGVASRGAPSALLIFAFLVAASIPEISEGGADVDRGRYLVIIGGCNDCHTPGYPTSDGAVAESQWLTGDQLGWRGPWGTTYPSNLRLFMQGLSEDAWLAAARNLRTRPPMPWFNLRQMTDEDLRAVYRFVRSLGPAGRPAPAYVPPEHTPQPPFVQFP